MSPFQASQRHLVLVLLDATGFARAAAMLAPAAAFEALARLHARLAGEIESSGGTVVKLIGDALLAVFEPRDAGRAVALMRRLGGTPCPEIPVPGEPSRLQARGHAGIVAWGPLGTAAGARPDVVGHAVNELFRLRGGDVVVSPALLALEAAAPPA